MTAGLTCPSPIRTVFDDPVRQCPFESDVMSGLFRLNPFVPKNFLAFSLELAIKRGILQQIVRWRCSFHSDRHRKFDAKLGFFNRIAIQISRWNSQLTQSEHIVKYFYPNCCPRALAIPTNAWAAGLFCADTTTGTPWSPPSRISLKIGISPRKGSFCRPASAWPPPWPKISTRSPLGVVK